MGCSPMSAGPGVHERVDTNGDAEELPAAGVSDAPVGSPVELIVRVLPASASDPWVVAVYAVFTGTTTMPVGVGGTSHTGAVPIEFTILMMKSSATRPCGGLPPRDSSITTCAAHSWPTDVPAVFQVSTQPGETASGKVAAGCDPIADSPGVAMRQLSVSPSASATGSVTLLIALTAICTIGKTELTGDELDSDRSTVVCTLRLPPDAFTSP